MIAKSHIRRQKQKKNTEADFKENNVFKELKKS